MLYKTLYITENYQNERQTRINHYRVTPKLSNILYNATHYDVIQGDKCLGRKCI